MVIWRFAVSWFLCSIESSIERTWVTYAYRNRSYMYSIIMTIYYVPAI